MFSRGFGRERVVAENKTKPHAGDVDAFIAAAEPEVRRADAHILIDLMQRITDDPPVMWGPSIVGFGGYHYRYESGREGDMPRAAFSPRKAELVVYVAEFAGRAAILARLGKHKASKGCLYIKKLADVDLAVLEEVVGAGIAHLDAQYERLPRARYWRAGVSAARYGIASRCRSCSSVTARAVIARRRPVPGTRRSRASIATS